MNDKKYILGGLLIFIVLFAFPFWFNLGKAAPAPKPVLSEKAKAAGKCVMPTEFMRAEHMKLLGIWRRSVVRNAKREFINPEGKQYDMSLQNTCLNCHDNKAQFCDKCHNYASVDVYCWSCHIDKSKGEE